MTTRRFQEGLSIIELMVAILIGLFLMLGAVSVFSNSKRVYVEQEDTSRLQEGLRFAMESITRDLRMAAYFGCTNTDQVGTASNPTGLYNALPASIQTAANYVLNPSGGGIEGFEGSATTKQWLPGAQAVTSSLGAFVTSDATVSATTFGAPVSTGSPDGIIIRHAGGPNWSMTAEMTSTTATLSVTNGPVNGIGVSAGNLAAVSNCRSTDVFRVSSVSTNAISGVDTVTPVNNTKLNTEYGEIQKYTINGTQVQYPTAFVSIYQPVAYYIGLGCIDADTDSNTATCSTPGPALFRQFWDSASASMVRQQMIAGVENMQVTYGIDNSGSDRIPDIFVAAGSSNLDSAAEWDDVVAVRVGLLIRSGSENSARSTLNTATYRVNDTDFNPSDDYRTRRTLLSTITLRNAAVNR